MPIEETLLNKLDISHPRLTHRKLSIATAIFSRLLRRAHARVPPGAVSATLAVLAARQPGKSDLLRARGRGLRFRGALVGPPGPPLVTLAPIDPPTRARGNSIARDSPAAPRARGALLRHVRAPSAAPFRGQLGGRLSVSR